MRDNERGATSVEYALIASLIAAVIAAVVTLVGEEVLQMFESVTWW
ncbi:MAG TPA: Flp family type IVb pilin [Actinomycetota bacterium]|nr:Flp family type IVb pilin [Actinomycetota bacterium]